MRVSRKDRQRIFDAFDALVDAREQDTLPEDVSETVRKAAAGLSELMEENHVTR